MGSRSLRHGRRLPPECTAIGCDICASKNGVGPVTAARQSLPSRYKSAEHKNQLPKITLKQHYRKNLAALYNGTALAVTSVTSETVIALYDSVSLTPKGLKMMLSATDLIKMDHDHLIHSLHHPADHTQPVIYVGGCGSKVRDIEGREYIDGLA